LRAFASLRDLWRVVRADLGKVSQPLLMLRSAVDHVVEPINAQIVLDNVRSDDITDVVLRDSYHVATLDNDAPVIFARSTEFMRRVHTERVKDLV
jgi:carboxylesterase